MIHLDNQPPPRPGTLRALRFLIAAVYVAVIAGAIWALTLVPW